MRNRHGQTGLTTFYHVDINLSVCIGLCHKATAIYIVDAGSGFDIYRNFAMGSDWNFFTLIVRFCSGIRCFITTANKVLDDNRITAISFFNIHSDIALDTATRIVTAIHILQNTAGDGQMHIAMNMSIVGTAMNIVYRTLRTCSQDDVYRTYITLVAGTIKSGNVQRATA